MATKRIIVTGGTGKAGHWIVKPILERGYDVVNVDVRQPEWSCIDSMRGWKQEFYLR